MARGAVETETKVEHVDLIRRVVVKESQLSIMTHKNNDEHMLASTVSLPLNDSMFNESQKDNRVDIVIRKEWKSYSVLTLYFPLNKDH